MSCNCDVRHTSRFALPFLAVQLPPQVMLVEHEVIHDNLGLQVESPSQDCLMRV